MNKTRIILTGACGRMGRAVTELAASDDRCEIVCGIDVSPNAQPAPFPVYKSFSEIKEAADVIIDFSHHSAVYDILSYAKEKSIPAVIATTGHDEDETALIEKCASDIPVFYSRNMSIGINLMIALSKKAAAILGDSFDIEIVEEHHSKKLDAPSGTALMIADSIKEELDDGVKYEYDRHSKREKRTKNEIGIHAVRGGTITGEHQVIFAGLDEIITISHSARSKELFATGAISSAKFICGKPAGLYKMSDMI